MFDYIDVCKVYEVAINLIACELRVDGEDPEGFKNYVAGITDMSIALSEGKDDANCVSPTTTTEEVE